MEKIDPILLNNTVEIVKMIDEKAREAGKQIKKELIEELLEAEIEEHLPLRYAKKRRARPTPFVCPHCGLRKESQVRRNGHYKRQLRVSEGVIDGLRVPMLECSVCGRKIKFRFRILDEKTRYWKDIDTAVSYRKIKKILGRRMAKEIGVITGWRRLQKMGRNVREKRDELKGKTIALDEAYIRVGGRKMWGLIAKKLEGVPKIKIFIAENKDKENWLEFLKEIPPPGVVVTDGDKAIESAVKEIWPKAKRQVCVWHILRDVARKAKENLSGEELTDFLRKCWEITKSGELISAYHKTKELVKTYGGIGYEVGLELGKGLEYLRSKRDSPDIAIPLTNSLLEREIKEFRRRVRPMDGFSSQEGARNFTALWVEMRNLQQQGIDWIDGIMAIAG